MSSCEAYPEIMLIFSKVEGLSYSSVVTPDLPSIRSRVSKDPPISHTGIVYAGPLYTRTVRILIQPIKVNKAYCIHVYFNKSCALGHGVL